MKKKKLIVCLVFLLMVVVFTGCAKENREDEKTIEYSVNNMSFEIYESWQLDKTDSDDDSEDGTLTFVKDEEDEGVVIKDSILIKSEKISVIEKIDTGDGGIKTKEDVVKRFSYGGSDFVDLTFSEWKSVNGIEYCEQYFEADGKLADGSYGKRLGREIVVPINGTEAYFLAVAIGDEETDMSNLDVIINSLHQN